MKYVWSVSKKTYLMERYELENETEKGFRVKKHGGSFVLRKENEWHKLFLDETEAKTYYQDLARKKYEKFLADAEKVKGFLEKPLIHVVNPDAPHFNSELLKDV